MKRILAAVITAAVIIGSFPMGIITRAAAPEEKLISMKFDLGGGTLAGRTGVIEIEAEEGSTIIVPAAPTKEGFIFRYWKGSEYYPGDTYVVSGDHTLTAEIEFPRWTLIVILMAIGVFCCIKLKKISGKKD